MNQVIWNGVGGIGDDLVSGANETAVRNHFRTRKRNLWIKYGSIAACLCLVVCLCMPWTDISQNMSGETAQEESKRVNTDKIHLPGSVVESDCAILTYVSCTENSVSFFLHIKNFERVNVSFNVKKQNGSSWDIATTDRPDEGNSGLGDVLKITVNGVSAEEIPASPGDYNITVDFSELTENDFTVDENFSITGFGLFALQKYGISGGTDISD